MDEIKKIKNREEFDIVASRYLDVKFIVLKTEKEVKELNAQIKNYMIRKVKQDKKGTRIIDSPDVKTIVKWTKKLDYDESQIETLSFFNLISEIVPAHRKFSKEKFKEAITNKLLTGEQIDEIKECISDNGYNTLTIKSKREF